MTWNVLKWVAIAAMLIDHTAAVMGGLFPFSWYDPMRDVGRIAFPIFAYGIAQGCVYTHSARRYLGRLLLFAVLSEIPYRLALRAGSLAFGLFNVFFTLLPDRQVLQEQGQALGLGGGGARGCHRPAVRDFGHGLRRLWGAVHFAALPVLGEQARPHHRGGPP